MKSFFMLSSFLMASPLFAQQISGMFMNLGAGTQSIHKTGFGNWVNQNYGRTMKPSHATINYDMAVIYQNRWSAGCEGSVALTQQAETADLFFGRLLTPVKYRFKSLLNAQVGGYYLYVPGIAPLNYTPPPSFRGRNLNLEGGGTYMGLSNRNLWFKKAKDPEKPGLCFELTFAVDYLLKTRAWNYGYAKHSGKYSHRYAQKMYAIPPVEKQFFTALTLSIGFGGQLSESNK